MSIVRRAPFAALAAVGCLLATVPQAQAGANAFIQVDENGNGYFNNPSNPLPFAMQPDPGPGGLNSVLTYFLNIPNVTQGDVGLSDADAGGAVQDYIRFNGNGTIVFYSDNVDGADALADTPSPPGAFYANLMIIPEVGPEGNNGASYTPQPGQPGFQNGFFPTYHFISDSVPEPGTLSLLGLAAVPLLRRKRRYATAGCAA